ncbi:Ribonuclease III [Thermogutta terrifontis]|uniref:Ribonuclease 3 n=1 Tax=Thermogutta terrifontis TaxID=1331910 RepID=A0A286RL11_9BACT|nr:ribonuclease III [Thermogutta terrifontis]ASV76654.1 Ribonuclease III [Thermogutta terrifontis]
MGTCENTDDPRVRACQEKIGYSFSNPRLLQTALTHASGAESRLESNERLEFLGDAVLGMVVCELLYKRLPHLTEGELTRLKSSIVSRSHCAHLARQLGLEELIIIGKGLAGQPYLPNSLLAAVFEAITAAIYLDGGLEAAKRFIEPLVLPELEAFVRDRIGENYKSVLQQISQRSFGTTPVYLLLEERGPDHGKLFKIAAQIGATRYQAAWGRSKKEAEQRAACNALHQLRELPPPCSDELGEDGMPVVGPVAEGIERFLE